MQLSSLLSADHFAADGGLTKAARRGKEAKLGKSIKNTHWASKDYAAELVGLFAGGRK